MLKKAFLSIAMVTAAVTLFFATSKVIGAASSPGAALTGQVSSQEEGRMGGVLVSAKRDGSTVTTTVVSDAQGRYRFPSSKLEPGRYSLRIRAVGYELENSQPAEVTAEKTTELDLKLRKAQDLAAQLSNGEWLLSMPGTDEQKQGFLSCVGCHTVERIARSRYSAEEFVPLLKRMRNYAQGSSPLRPQVRPGARRAVAKSIAADDQVRAVFEHDQFEQGFEMGISAENAAAAQGHGHPGDHHRVRPAASGGHAT
jgi:virginiamycin B lyase